MESKVEYGIENNLTYEVKVKQVSNTEIGFVAISLLQLSPEDYDLFMNMKGHLPDLFKDEIISVGKDCIKFKRDKVLSSHLFVEKGYDHQAFVMAQINDIKIYLEALARFAMLFSETEDRLNLKNSIQV